MEAIERMKDAVVKVVTGVAVGSGTYCRELKAVITNYHVVRGERRVAIELASGERYVGQVLTVNPGRDIAFVSIAEPLALPEVHLTPCEVKQQERVFALGFPFNLPFTITAGIVSSPEYIDRDVKYIQTDAAINPGNSGGPLVNQNGQILGMNTQMYRDAQNVGFALLVAYVIEEIDMFKEDGVFEGYHVRCPSCSLFLSESAEYCDNCGANISTQQYFQERSLNDVEAFVESEIAKTGRDPIITRQGSHQYWRYYQGSAQVRLFVYQGNFLFAVAPLVKLPRKNIVELYKYMASAPVPPYRFTMTDDVIFLAYRTHLSDLGHPEQREQIGRDLMGVADKADELDTYLVNRFHCRWATESRQEAEGTQS